MQPRGRAVGQPQHVVEEAVLLVPHAVPSADLVHGRGDPEEVLDELERDVLVAGIVLRQLDGDLQHVLAEERHPGGAVGLLEVAAGRQRRAAVEDADVVEAEEAAFEHVAARAVLAVDPPGEVHQQLAGSTLEEVQVPLATSDLLHAYGRCVAHACTGGLTSLKFHS